jgi:polyisoprenoid-binding protein YceI
MTRLTSILSLSLVLAMAGWQTQETDRYEIIEGSTLWVEGTSSLHDWRCDVVDMAGTFSIDDEEQVTDVVSASFSVASNLECKNGTMNRKAHAALGVKDHPSITFELTSSEVEAGEEGAFTVKAVGLLSIAGETREVTTTVHATRNESDQLVLSGFFPVKMSDFNVKPPKAMLGTIKTGDDITVHFQFISGEASNL